MRCPLQALQGVNLQTLVCHCFLSDPTLGALPYPIHQSYPRFLCGQGPSSALCQTFTNSVYPVKYPLAATKPPPDISPPRFKTGIYFEKRRFALSDKSKAHFKGAKPLYKEATSVRQPSEESPSSITSRHPPNKSPTLNSNQILLHELCLLHSTTPEPLSRKEIRFAKPLHS